MDLFVELIFRYLTFYDRHLGYLCILFYSSALENIFKEYLCSLGCTFGWEDLGLSLTDHITFIPQVRFRVRLFILLRNYDFRSKLNVMHHVKNIFLFSFFFLFSIINVTFCSVVEESYSR